MEDNPMIRNHSLVDGGYYETNKVSLKGRDIVNVEYVSDNKGRPLGSVLITTKYKYYYKEYCTRDDNKEIYNKLRMYRLENEEYPSINLSGEISYWHFETSPGCNGIRIVNKKKRANVNLEYTPA